MVSALDSTRGEHKDLPTQTAHVPVVRREIHPEDDALLRVLPAVGRHYHHVSGAVLVRAFQSYSLRKRRREVSSAGSRTHSTTFTSHLSMLSGRRGSGDTACMDVMAQTAQPGNQQSREK